MNSIELTIYWLIWCSSLLFAFYSFATDSKYLVELVDTKDLSDGWLWNGLKDVSDYEWNAIRDTFLSNFKHILIYLILTQIIAKYKPKYLSHFFVIYSSVAIIVVLNLKSLLIIWSNILAALLIQSFGNQLMCYILFVLSLYSVHNSPIFVNSSLELDERQQFLFEVCTAWLNAKCLSLSIDRIRSQTHKSFGFQQLVQCMAFCLYLPAFFTGPIHLYNTFIEDINEPVVNWNRKRIVLVITQVIRFTFWSLIYELFLHFIYSSSIQFYPELAEMLSAWSLCGLGFALPLMFFVKYFIIYGSVAAIAEDIQGFRMSSPPKCVARIHSSSFLWRHFDRGLYSWLQCYFYKPIVGSNWNNWRKALAGSVVFSCVCLWHGMDRAVVIWSVLNFFGVSIEMIVNSFYLSKIWTSIEPNISADNQLRIRALIASPFFTIAFVSNLFFLSNWEVGYCFIRKILFTIPLPLLPTIFVMYCGCHVSLNCIQRHF